MKRVRIAGDLTTSQLGFGCALLAGGTARKMSLGLLAAAFDAGVTHFDVAPSYGMGVAEGVLGEFISGRRDAVTVTTKVGLARPAAPGVLTLARSVARPLLALTPALRRRLGRGVYRMSVARARFGLAQVERSLAESLKHLRTDRVEFLLLHEITPEDVTDELLRFAEESVRTGKVGACGIGSPRSVTERIGLRHPELACVVQTNWSAGDVPLAINDARLKITHGSLRRLDDISAWLRFDLARLRRLSDAVGVDLGIESELAECLLAAAFAANRSGIVLLGTHRRDRISRNAALSSDAQRLQSGAKLADALSVELPAKS